MDLRKILISGTIVLQLPLMGQLVLTNTMTPQQLVQDVLLGSGVQVSNVTFNGVANAPITVQAMSFDGTNCNVGMGAGLLLCTGDANLAIGPNNSGGATLPGFGLGLPGDPDLTQALNSGGGNYATNDAAVLEFDFIPNGDSLSFKYVFGSEEYLEWVNSSFNDVFGFFLSGPGINGPYANNAINIALVPGTLLPVTIDNVNDFVNPTYYVDNGDGWSPPQTTDSTVLQFDGFTTVLTANALVECGLQYHIKLAVADAGDLILDSGVFLQAGSFTSSAAVTAQLSTVVGLVDSTLYEGCANAVLSFIRYGDFSVGDSVDVVVSGTATNGVDYVPPIPSQVIFLPGDSIVSFVLTAPMDADGPEQVDLTMLNVANCSGQLVVTDFTFYIDMAQTMYITTQDSAIGCDDFVDIGPQVFEGYGNYQYAWSTGATTATINVSPPVTTTYYVTVSDTCGMPSQSDSITISVPVYPPVVIQVSNDTSITCLETVDIGVTSVGGGDGVYTYAWTDADGVLIGNTQTITVTSGPAATYYVEVEAGCGISAIDSVTILPSALPPVMITATADLVVLCTGDSADLVIEDVTGGNGIYTYSWSDGAQVISDSTTISVWVNDTAVYYVSAVDQCGNMGSTSVTVYTPQYDPVSLLLMPTTIICQGDSLELYAFPLGGSGQYIMDWPGNGWSDPLITVAPTTTTTYPVGIVDDCGATAMGAIMIVVDSVEAAFVMNYTGDLGVQLISTSSPNAVWHLWDLGDGERSRAPWLEHSYLDLEEHWITLMVGTVNGCIDTTRMLYQPAAHIYIPNAFTPDGDGVNEVFGPVGHDIESLDLMIFDRWGELIYRSDRMDRLWDGSIDGAPAQAGVYVYKVRVKGRRMGPVERYGHVTLVR